MCLWTYVCMRDIVVNGGKTNCCNCYLSCSLISYTELVELIPKEKKKKVCLFLPFFPLFPSQNLKKVFVEFSHQELFEFYNKVCRFYNTIASL